MSKWFCSCTAINPEFSYKCHNCGKEAPKPTYECQCCKSEGIDNVPATKERQNTSYEDDERNWAILCEKHHEENDQYWAERWREYWADRL
jgi:hypothetical protein